MVIIMAVITHEYYYYRITVLTCEIPYIPCKRGKGSSRPGKYPIGLASR